VTSALGQVTPSDALELLSTVSRARARARAARLHVWVLPALLGVVLAFAVQVYRTALLGTGPIAHCIDASLPGRGHSGCVTAPKQGAGATFTGSAGPAWSPGSNAVFWVAVTTAIFLVYVAILASTRKAHRARSVFVSGAAVVFAVGAGLLMHESTLVAPLANIAACGVALAVIAAIEGCKTLAIVDAAVVACGIVMMHLLPSISLSDGLYLPSSEVVQAAVGALFLVGAVGLRYYDGVVSLGVWTRVSHFLLAKK
jgi:hypothetical protein